jgi:hypothetical protein
LRDERRTNDEYDQVADALVDVLEKLGALRDPARLIALGFTHREAELVQMAAHGESPFVPRQADIE